MFYLELFFIFILVFNLGILEYYDQVFHEYHALNQINTIGIEEYLKDQTRKSRFRRNCAIAGAVSIIMIGGLHFYFPQYF